MTSFTNHAPVHNQVGVQNISGNVITYNVSHIDKRSRLHDDDLGIEKKLDDDILASLAFREMFDRRSQVEIAHRQTCQWIFDLEAFKVWRNAPDGLLWIKGKPGCGKSTLMSHIHRALWSQRSIEEDINLEFFFSARGTSLQRTPSGMLRSLLVQLFNQDSTPRVRDPLRTRYEEKSAHYGNSNIRWEWQLTELKQLLADMVSACARHRRMTILVDALDEAGQQSARDMAMYFLEMDHTIQNQAGKAKICIACRHYPIPFDTDEIEIHVERHNHDDIRSFVEDSIIPVSALYSDRQQERIEIAQELVTRADGIFQWASLVVQMVSRWMSDGESMREIRNSLSHVPEDLEAVYEHILRNVIDSRYRRKTLLLFQWVCFAQQPLSLLELRYALSAGDTQIVPATVRCHELSDFERSSWRMSQRVKAWSGGLLEVVPDSAPGAADIVPRESLDTAYDKQKVLVIHQTVGEFLATRGLTYLTSSTHTDGDRSPPSSTWTYSRALKLSHEALYLSCLKYLCTEAESLPPLKTELKSFDRASDEERTRIKADFPFLLYSATHVMAHARQCNDHRSWSLEKESEHLKQSLRVWPFVMKVTPVPLYGFLRWNPATDATVLHVAVSADLEDLVRYRLDNNDDVNAADANGWTSAHVAAAQGDTSVMQLLVAAGASLRRRTARGDTPLLLAAKYSRTDMFSYIMSQGCDPSTTAADPGLVLCTAAREGAVAICKLCIAAQVDVNTQSGIHGNALQAAATRAKNLNVIRLLVDAGAAVNAQGGYYGNALQAAANHTFSNNIDTVRYLLEVGADVNAQGGYLGNALQAAAREKFIDVVCLLLDAGADVKARGGHYGTALQAAAARNKSATTVRLLLEAGSDVHDQGGTYGNALQAAAAYRDNTDAIRVLLEAGANVNSQGGQYGSALQAAAALTDNMDAVELLLKAGADVNASGGYHGSALQAATRLSENVDVVRLLLKAGADVNAGGGHFGNALQAAAASHRDNLETARLLLDLGANVNAPGGSYGSALQAAASQNQVDMVRLLLEAGADANVQGGHHGNALKAAARYKNNTDVVRLLLEAGANVDIQVGGNDGALPAQRPAVTATATSMLSVANTSRNEHESGAIEAKTSSGHQEEIKIPSDNAVMSVETQPGLRVITGNHSGSTIELDMSDGSVDSEPTEAPWLLQMLGRFFPWS